jgi:hypothetical protein
MRRSFLKESSFIAAFAVLVGSSAAMFVAIEAAGVYLQKRPIYPRSGKSLNALPTETQSWKRVGTDVIENPEVVKVLGTQNYLTRTYREKDPAPGTSPREIQLHAAYYTGMIDGVQHIPDRCLVAGGMRAGERPTVVPLELDDSTWLKVDDVPEQWQDQIYTVRTSPDYSPARGARMTLPRSPHDMKMRVLEFFDDRTETHLFAGYFFIANGGAVETAEGVRLLAFDLEQDYAYYLKLQFVSTDVDTAEQLGELVSGFLSEIIGDVMFCVPDWIEVQRGEWPERTEVNKPG